MTLDLSPTKGGDRAYAAVASSGKGGKITRGDDSATVVYDDTIATIKCLEKGRGDSLVIVIVAGNNGSRTKSLMTELRDGMRSGVFE